jgi:hypothetical protein
MLATVDFDDETPLEADEIKNEALKGHLATELEVCEAVIAQQLPHTRASASVGSRRILFAKSRMR